MNDDEKWRDKLTEQEYRICREKATEAPFSGEYWNKTDAGIYRCKCCGIALFDAQAKYDSLCGWPSFFQALDNDRIRTAIDTTLAQTRVEIMCDHCGSHLGHVFDDGPAITGKRFCVNSASLDFEQQK